MKSHPFSKSLFFLMGTFFFLWGSPVWADPVLDVNVSSNVVLLGGTARYTVTVTNADATDKGYNLSFSSVFSSDRIDPEGSVEFHSASDSIGNLAPTTVITDPVTGDTTIDFINIKDLAANETYSFTLTVDMASDSTWESMDDIVHNITATVNAFPDGSGVDISDNSSDTSDVLPIALMNKGVDRSTGAEQVTGTIDRQYGYTIEVQNNYTNDTDDVTVTDILPDGIEFLGVTSGHSCTDSRENDTGITTVICDLDTMSPGDNEIITYDAGIRYDFFGTNNGGTNRTHDDFDGTPVLGVPVPDKMELINHVDLDAEYQGDVISTQSKDFTVTAAYATVGKSGHISQGGNGDVINYVITYITSEYYEILDDNEDIDTSSITLHDILPDGQTFNDNASPAQSSYTENGDGTTDIYWNSSVLSGLENSDSFDVTFSATVGTHWDDGTEIVGADSMNNTVDSHGEWDDLRDTSRDNDMTDSSASAGFSMATPQITKEVEDPNNPGTWLESVPVTVGDQLKFRVRFNTIDGLSPELMNVNLGDIVVTDWLPPGLNYNDDAVISNSGNDFSGSNYDDDPNSVTIGGLDGLEWNLGDVDHGGWWQAEFTVFVEDVSGVTEGKMANNIWKMTGLNTEGVAYSDRDNVEVAYYEPHLILTKTATNVPDPLLPSSAVEYTLSVQNTGSAPARDMLVTDVLSSRMQTTTPSIDSVSIGSTNLSEGADYELSPAYDSSMGVFSIDLSNSSSIETDIAAGETLTIVYTVAVDGDVGMYAELDNIATTSYNTQHDGSGRATSGTNNVSDDNTDDESIQLARPSINKSISSGPYRIGDVISYTVDVTVPAGHILYWPDVRDRFSQDGVSYVDNSTALADQSGTPVTNASFSSGANPTIDAGQNNRTWLTWYLNNSIDNRGQASDYTFRLTYDVRYDGVEDDVTSWEFAPTNTEDHDNARLNNRAYIRWTDENSPSRTVEHTRFDNADTDIDQPLLETEKSTLTTGPYSSGSMIDYQVVVTNAGQAMAHDITWSDQLSSFVENYTFTSATHNVNGLLTSGVDYVENFSGNPLTINFDGSGSDTNLAPSESITILYSVQVGNDVGAGSDIANTADVNWSSQDGPGTGERIYDDSSSENGYTLDTDDVTAMVADSSFTKSIISPASGQLTIGEEVEYSVRVTIPAETVAYSPTIEDVVTSDGMEYVAGSVNVQYVSGDPETTASISGVPTLNTTSPSPGTTTIFTFDINIDNSSSSPTTGDTPYVFDVRYRMRATGLNDSGNWIWDPSATHTVTNAATGKWNDGSTDHSVTADDVDVTIVQPYIETIKNFDVESVIGGDTVHATVTIENIGSSTVYAHDTADDLIDTMPVGFYNPQNISLVHSENGILTLGVDYTILFSDNDFLINLISTNTNIAAGEDITVEYDVSIDPLIGSGSDISNVFDVDYSSMSGSQTNERVYDDSDALEGTDDEDEDNVIVESALLDKTVNGDNDYTIGEEFSYSLVVTIPENTSVYNSVLTDVVPDGLTFISYDQVTAIGSVVADPEVNGTRQIIWDIGDVSNLPVGQLLMDIHVRVDDTFDSGTQLDGLPVSVDGDVQDTLTNNAQFAWDAADTGGSSHTTDDEETITIIEPYPTIAKSVDTSTATARSLVEYIATVGNTGTSNLYNIVVTDTLDAQLFTTGGSPAVSSITHSDDGTLIQGTHYTFDNSANPVVITFDSSVNLVPTETLSIVYDAGIHSETARGSILQNAVRVSYGTSLAADGDYDREYSTTVQNEIVTVIAPDMEITKDDGGAIVDPGDTILYTLSYANAGDAVAPSVVVTETVPDHTTFDASASSPGWICSDVVPASTCTYNVGDVGVSGADSSIFALTVDNPLASGVSAISNTATVTDDGTNGADPTPSNNTDNDSTPVSGFVDLAVEKDDGGIGVIQGENIAYAITYSNNGDQNATGVEITETVPDHTTFDASASSPGWACIDVTAGSTCTYNVGSLVGGTSGTLDFYVITDDPLPQAVNEISNIISIADDGAHGPDADTENDNDTELTPVVFDPPSALKTLNAEGLPEIEWKMVWINNGNTNALGVQVLDPIPEGIIYVPGSIDCDARGSSVTSVCTYDTAENRVRWEGNIGPDAGHTTEENSDNEVVITFRTDVPDEIVEVHNQARACWDANGNGDFEDDCLGGQTPVTTDDPGTNEDRDPTSWIRESYSGNSIIGNYIWHDKNNDGKQDDDESGLENVRVKLVWAGPDDKFGTRDDQVWRTDTNHNGHYLFEDLPEGEYKVKVKEEDVRGWIQTYDPGNTMNNKSRVSLGENDYHTKADFGYNMTGEKLAQTGDNGLLVLIISMIVGVIAGGWFLWQRKKV